MTKQKFQSSESGQIMTGFYIALIVIITLTVTVMNYFSSVRQNSSRQEYKDLALMVARSGYEEGLSYFRRQPNGVFTDVNKRPPSQAWFTPWCAAAPCPTGSYYWPDDAFRPGPSDTDYFNLISVTAADGSAVAGGIVRSFPLHLSRTVLAGSELYKSGLWGRYVIRRQSTPNWSPGANTMAVNNDPDAAHDISAQRDFSSSQALGSGNFWSMTSRGYVFASADDVTVAASCENNSLLNAPLQTYLSRPLLVASAKVYGELFRISFSVPDAAVFVAHGNYVRAASASCAQPLGYIRGGAGAGIARNDATSGSNLATTCFSLTGTPAYVAAPTGFDPTVAAVFPGMDRIKLQGIADYVGDMSVLPNDLTPTAVYETQVARQSFYYIKNASSPASTFTFSPANHNHFNGTGLIFIDGNLSITAGTFGTSWFGVVYVNGNAYINGPAEVNGALVVGGSICYLMGDNLGTGTTTSIVFSAQTRDATEKYLQKFRVLKSSVISSYN